MIRKIPVSQPFLDGTETRLVVDALERGEISGYVGEYLPRFEQGFAEFSTCRHGVAVSSGTTALHLALAALGIARGDEVLVSTLTNMATLFAILYQGAVPVPIDIEPDTFNLDPALLEARVTRRTRAILVVHLFGHPVEMTPVLDVAERHSLAVVEDCAEAHGAEYRGRRVGGLGQIGCFSFYGNKILTTGEGGMCTTQDADLATRMRSLRSLGFGREHKFMHESVAYNYRLTNLQAAIGCGQLEKLETIIARKRAIAGWYRERLERIDCLQLPVEKDYARHVYWMYHIGLLGRASERRDELMRLLAESGVETRDGFIPANLQRIFLAEGWVKASDCPRANAIAWSTFYLPSGAGLEEADVDYVCDRLHEVVHTMGL